MPAVPGVTSRCSRTPPVLPSAVTLGTEPRSLSCLSGSHTPTRWNKSASRAPLSDVFPLLISKSSLKERSSPGGCSSSLGDGGESGCRGSVLAPGCSPPAQRAPSSAPAPTQPMASSPEPHTGPSQAPGQEETSREKSWMGKRPGGLSSSEPISALWPEQVLAAVAALAPQKRHSPPHAGTGRDLWPG